MSAAESRVNGPRKRLKLMKRHKDNLGKWAKNPTSGFPWIVAVDILRLLADDYIIRQMEKFKEAQNK